MERDAFKELEEAMISASIPKKERINIVGGLSDNGLSSRGSDKIRSRK